MSDVEEVKIGMIKCKCREDERDEWRTVAVCESLGTAEQIARALNAISAIEMWVATPSDKLYDVLVDAIYFS